MAGDTRRALERSDSSSLCWRSLRQRPRPSPPSCPSFWTGTSVSSRGAKICVAVAAWATPASAGSSCSVGQAPLNGQLGNCSQVLQAGQVCTPVCDQGYDVDGLVTCSNGALSIATCRPKACNVSWPLRGGPGDCPAVLLSGSNCTPGCPSGYFPTANTSCLLGALTQGPCCPANSTAPVGGTSQDCKCKVGFIENGDGDGSSWSCRALRPCNLLAWLSQVNVTAGDKKPLGIGTCDDYQSPPSVMQHSATCRLSCPSGAAPQVGEKIFKSVDPTVMCQDGVITSEITSGTWCSEASWEVPSLVFLGVVSFAALMAGLEVELRVRGFEQRCARAFFIRLESLLGGGNEKPKLA